MYEHYFGSFGDDGGRELSKQGLSRLMEKTSARVGMWALTRTLPTRGDGPIKREVRETARQLLGSTDGLSDARGRSEFSAFNDHRYADRPLPPRLKAALGVGGVLAAASIAFVGGEIRQDLHEMLTPAAVEDARLVEDFLPPNLPDAQSPLSPSNIDWLAQPLQNAVG